VSGTSQNVYGSYGVKGVATSSNLPGSRHSVVGWTNKDGHLWMFGGTGRAESLSGNAIHISKVLLKYGHNLLN
jgi:hypothetical protein